MTGDTYYLLTSLPSLGDLGSTPPISLADLLDRVGMSDGNRALVETLFLSDDLLQRQAGLVREIEEVDPAVLTRGQARNEEPLPEYLSNASDDSSGGSLPDALWEAYFRHALSMAESLRSEFLLAWVRYEVSLRNALAVARAKALNLDAQSYMVAPGMGGDEAGFAGVISEWSAAADPLAGLRVLDQARWRWLHENDDWFSFEDDEVAAYAAKLMLLHRWKRLTQETAEARSL